MKKFVINCNKENLENLRKISQEIKGEKDIVILFENSEYHWQDEKAISDFELLLEGKLDYDTHWGKLGIPYNKGIVFEDVENLTFDGCGAKFIMYGLIAPFTFINCKNVRIENFSINWNRPPFTPCHIRKVDGEKITIEAFEGFEFKGTEPLWAIMEFDTIKKRIGEPWQFRIKDHIHLNDDGTAYFNATTNDGTLKPGNDLIVRHIGNYRPVFHLYKGENFRFKNIDLLAGPGMGIVGHLTNNVMLRNFNVKPNGNLMMSTNTDATHFISCDGLIDVENCYFEGMGDDAINVHGFYNSITDIIDEKTLKVTILNPNGTQDLIFDAPGDGSEIEFSEHDVLFPFAKNKVIKAEISKSEWSAILTLEYPLDKRIKIGDLLTDCTRVAGMRFVNCHINSVRARSALIQTRNVLMENCLIENCTGTGIHIDTATGWYESIGADNVIVRNNTIRDCGYGDATYCETSGIAITTECPQNKIGVHKNIVLENNYIDCNYKNGIFASCTDGIVIQNNTLCNCNNAILVENCDNITLKNNKTKGAIIVQNESFGFEDIGV